MTLPELKKLAVSAFPASFNRPILFETLSIFLANLARSGLLCEIWIAGSFMTYKPDPQDIDIVVVYDRTSANELSDAKWTKADALLNPSLSPFQLIDRRAVASTDQDDLAYWTRHFGTQRDDITPIGLALVRLHE